ncbi:glucose-1-phosphate adenylyltransferase subunit GlgD [Sediminibacillus massiliensis]|uniref:glucose-1-phosphate adenylyltransferase subunit GlgD n=1 Tax=Sediminibacillus massiliensis TaxID=1926277 RepID=UPI0009884D0C|nr:glucose-1-phosphate adenylyltransferase subunit GlgD [Sediminibacillus massiliensis]
MDTMMGLINLENEHDFLNELTYFRCGAAAPFAARYRLIDFALSNMVMSGVQDVAIFARKKYRSLMDHLGTGADWDLDRRHGGLFILPPDWNDPSDISKGDLSHFHNNRDYFERGRSSYVLISGSQFINNADYQDAFQFHLDRQADITLISATYDELYPEHDSCLKITSDEGGWVNNLSNDPYNHRIFTGVYIISKKLLLELVDECIAHYKDHFFIDAIKANLDRLNVQVYETNGYSAVINSIESFYRHNMNLLDTENFESLFYNNALVMTKIGNQPPTKYREGSRVNRSLLANGCVIDGDVDNSILFRGVHVKAGATVKNSILMQRCTIEPGVHLENVILDKDVTVTENQRLTGVKEQPFVIAKRRTI